MKVANGTYAPNRSGALSLEEVCALKIGPYAITAKIEDGWATGFAGEHQIFRRMLPFQDVHGYGDLYTWLEETALECPIVVIGDSGVQDDGHGYAHVDVTIARGAKAKNFGQRAAATARRLSKGLPVRRISSGGVSTPEYETHSYVYHW